MGTLSSAVNRTAQPPDRNTMWRSQLPEYGLVCQAIEPMFLSPSYCHLETPWMIWTLESQTASSSSKRHRWRHSCRYTSRSWDHHSRLKGASNGLVWAVRRQWSCGPYVPCKTRLQNQKVKYRHIESGFGWQSCTRVHTKQSLLGGKPAYDPNPLVSISAHWLPFVLEQPCWLQTKFFPPSGALHNSGRQTAHKPAFVSSAVLKLQYL